MTPCISIIFSPKESSPPPLFLCVCVYLKKKKLLLESSELNVSDMDMGDKRLIRGEAEDTAWSVYHTVQGKEGRGDKMKQGPSAERWASHANSSPFPEHQRSLCYPGFWPRQETPDPSLKAGELKQSVPGWKDLDGTHILPAHRSGVGGRGCVCQCRRLPGQGPPLHTAVPIRIRCI